MADITESQRRWISSHKEELQSNLKLWRLNNVAKVQAYRKLYNSNNRDKKLIWDKNYRANSKLKRKIKYKTDTNYRISTLLRNRIRKSLKSKNTRKNNSSIILLGCSIAELKVYLESKFQPGMNWNNQGYHGWHIDHIIPCVAFNLSIEEEQKKCFHYTNLQPLWKQDNLDKKIQLNWKRQ